ncbi:MAG TPA: hypothetical protein PL155_00675 [Candidatus Omnitrophota bacterium]|nr:hypothetical protein [Candidatus Omnitrophota bacterium]HPD84999.1 hypothetical protein [Candidatus Omnitrophota bacterium]HRZ03857.1 hypothetical protein [Candidatus Omnitrophota bacterium]
MDFITIFLAGLIDSVNPCALAVWAYLIAYIFFVNYSRRQILLFGNFFILGIFLSTLLIEWGAFGVFRNLEVFSVITNTAHAFLGVLAVVLGILNFYDWIICRKTGDCERSIFLKIGAGRSGGIHGPGKVLFIAILGGFVFGILSSAGRGYPYFPVAVGMLVEQGRIFKAVVGVALYSLALIIPLPVILILLLKGLKGRNPADFVKIYFSKVKIISAAVFLGLGLGLLFMFA